MMALKKKYSILKKHNERSFYLEGTKALSDSRITDW